MIPESMLPGPDFILAIKMNVWCQEMGEAPWQAGTLLVKEQLITGIVGICRGCPDGHRLHTSLDWGHWHHKDYI